MRPILCLALLLALTACSSPVATKEPTAPETEEQKTLYALGLALSQRLSAASFSEADLAMIEMGLGDGLLGRTSQVDMRVYHQKIDALVNARLTAGAEHEKELAKAYLDGEAAKPGAVRTASGALYFEVSPGNGATPVAADSVKLHYHGTLRDGSVFDSSVDRGEPAVFVLTRVIPCFSEGIQKMKVGGKARLVCPSETAYGDRGQPPVIRPGAAINFDVELIEVLAASPADSTGS